MFVKECNTQTAILYCNHGKLYCTKIIKKQEKNKFSPVKYNSVTDYLTFKSDFFKLVEFVEWLKENYPEKILSYKE